MVSLQRHGIASQEHTENPRVIVLWKASKWMGERNLEISVIEMEIQRGSILHF